MRLDDFKGSWLILLSHPADFTPVCTTEFLAFAAIAPELKKRKLELLGPSFDSTYSHIAWVRNIEEKFKVKIPFPIIADLDKEVATAFGMIMPGESKTESRSLAGRALEPAERGLHVLDATFEPLEGREQAVRGGPRQRDRERQNETESDHAIDVRKHRAARPSAGHRGLREELKRHECDRYSTKHRGSWRCAAACANTHAMRSAAGPALCHA